MWCVGIRPFIQQIRKKRPSEEKWATQGYTSREEPARVESHIQTPCLPLWPLGRWTHLLHPGKEDAVIGKRGTDLQRGVKEVTEDFCG